jgi:hypothetical protein
MGILPRIDIPGLDILGEMLGKIPGIPELNGFMLDITDQLNNPMRSLQAFAGNIEGALRGGFDGVKKVVDEGVAAISEGAHTLAGEVAGGANAAVTSVTQGLIPEVGNSAGKLVSGVFDGIFGGGGGFLKKLMLGATIIGGIILTLFIWPVVSRWRHTMRIEEEEEKPILLDQLNEDSQESDELVAEIDESSDDLSFIDVEEIDVSSDVEPVWFEGSELPTVP